MTSTVSGRMLGLAWSVDRARWASGGVVSMAMMGLGSDTRSGVRWRAIAASVAGCVALGLVAGPAGVAAATPVGVPPSGVGGHVIGWGYDKNGQTDVPRSLTGQTVTAIAAGVQHSLALTSTGKIVAWGARHDNVGQTDVPASLSGQTVTAIAAGGFHSLALTSAGRVVAWGYDGDGETDVPASLSGQTVTAIAAGARYSLALTSAGQVVAWGDDAKGQTDVPASLSGQAVTAIAAGGYHSLALTSTGRVVAWGVVFYGRTDPPQSLADKTVTAIAAGYYQSLALTSTGRVAAWGNDSDGETDVPASLSGQTVTAIAAGASHSLALTSAGHLVAWGDDAERQTDVPASLSGQTVTAIAASYEHNLAISSAPAVARVAPSSGPRAGGTSVAITGSGFSGASGVTFAGTSATSYTVDSDNRITAVAPAHPAGDAPVAVRSRYGTGTTAAEVGTFTYVIPPVVSGVSPASGPASGGQAVTITGSHFAAGTPQVSFGRTPATDVSRVSATEITATSPAHAAGPVRVRVRTVDGSSTPGPNAAYTFTDDPVAGRAQIQIYGP